MLEKIKLDVSLDKKEYKAELEVLEKELMVLQLKIKELQIPVIIALDGWSASGKGTLIGKIVRPLDPRYFNVYTMGKVSENAARRPFFCSYFEKFPQAGEITIFDKSWCRALLPDISEKWKLKSQVKEHLCSDINALEKQLTDDGTVVIKLFLHIGKVEQKKRLKELEKNESTSWRVNTQDFLQNEKYELYVDKFDQMIESTNVNKARWNIIEASDRKHAAIKAYKIIIEAINHEINARQQPKIQEAAPKFNSYDLLNNTETYVEMGDKEYRELLDLYQMRINELSFKLYTKPHSVVIVFEGFDASGKGGNIKRVTEAMDPRCYEVVPISAPTKEELNHHYLWRFYKRMPKDGHIAIFDRSWYGRVMVERLEGYCPTEAWVRAYDEINEMEKYLTHHGVILFKFWLHIDKDEQLKRFNKRQADPLKQYKITDEDWRNREKWDLYVEAVNDMIEQTNTNFAPWDIIEANNKKFARIKVLEKIVTVLEKRLEDVAQRGKA